MRKRILALLLAIVMAVGLLPTAAWAAPSGYTTDSNELMAYEKKNLTTAGTGGNTDVMGKYKDNWINTTYQGQGYSFMAKDGLNTSQVSTNCQFINGGRYVQLNYTVTAGDSGVTGGKLGVCADIQIGSNDTATVTVIRNSAGKVIGLKMVDVKTANPSYGAQFNLYFDGVSGVTPVSTYWFGFFQNSGTYCYDNLSAETERSSTGYYTKDGDTYTGLSGCDSGMALSWQNINLEAGQSKTFSFIVGVGEEADPPAMNGDAPITLTANIAANDNGKTVDVTANVTDASGRTDTLYYSVDGGVEQVVGSVTADGSAKDITGQISLSGLSNGEHTLAFWVVNSSGALSPSVTRTVTVSDNDVEGLDIAPAPAHSHAVADGEEDIAWTAWEDATRLPTTGNYYLTCDVTVSGGYSLDGVLNLCLNGYTINESADDNGIYGGVYTVGDGKALNLCDCSDNAAGTIVNRDGTAIYIFGGGTVHVYGGTLQSTGATSSRSFGIHNAAGTLYVYGGSLKGTGAQGCGLYTGSNSKSYLYGGAAQGTKYGILNENGTVYLSGSPSVAGGADSGDICFNGRFSSLYASDTSNVPYTGDATLHLAFGSEFSLDVDKTVVSKATSANKGKFALVTSAYTLRFDEGTGALKLQTPAPAHSHAVSVDCSTTEGDQVEFTAWDGRDMSENNGQYGVYLNPGSYYLTDDVTIDNPLKINSGTVNLCLNGHTINIRGIVQVLGTLNICDCSQAHSGKIKNTGNTNAVVADASGSKVNLYGGTVEGKYGLSANSTGAEVTIYGGTVKGSEYALRANDENAVITLYGSPTLDGETADVFLNYATLHIGDTLAQPSAAYTVEPYSYTSPARFTSGWSTHMSQVTDLSKYIVSANSGYDVAVDGSTGELTFSKAQPAHSHDGVTFTPWNGTDGVTYTGSTASLYLTKDVTRSDVGFSVPAGKSLHLCLNGFTVSGNILTGLFSVDKGGALTVCDCSESSTGKIHSGDGFGCVGVYNQGAFILKSGTVEGTAVGVYNGGNNYDCTINGGVVTGQSGVYNQGFGAYAKTFIKGGTITGSTEYGVQNYAAGTELYLSGAPSITGEKADIYTDADSSYIYADDSALPATPYSGKVLSLGYPSPLTSGNAVVRHVTEATEDKFKLADQDYGLTLDKTNRILIITKSQVVTPHTCTGMGESVTFDKALTADTLNITESGNYYLPASLNLGDSGVTIGEGITVKLCLNGYDLNYSKNRGEAIKVKKGGALELCDCTGYGHITATDSESAIFLSGAALIQHSGVVSAKKGNGITMSYDDGGDEDNPAQWIASTATIKGGSVLGDAAGINAAGGSLTITGGDIEARGTNSESGQPVAALYCMAMDALTISGGQFEGVYGLYLISYGDNGTQLSGGQFYSKAGGHPIYIPDGIVIGEPLTYADLLVNGYAYKDINSGATLTGKEAIEAATAIKVEQGGSTPTPSHTHAWATAWEKNETHHWHECVGAGICDITSNSGKNGYATHTWNDGVVTKEPTATAEGVKTYTCTVCAATKTEPVPIPTFNVSGTVTDSEDTAVEGATVKLMRGSTQVASTTTDASGNYSFANVTPGSYNVVAEQTQDGSTKTMTILVTITNANLSNQNLKMPSDSVNSVLEVKGNDTPAVVVGGLEKEAEANKEENSTVTVTMTVEGKEENTAANAAEIKAAAGEDKTLEYLEIKVEKTVEADGSTTTDAISTTSNLLTIVIPFDFTGKVQSSVTVYRYHNGSVDTLTTTASGDGERIVLGADSITLYVKNFSTYAIGYTKSAEVNYTVTFDSQGGSAVASQTVAQNGKVTRPVNPTKSGYSFGGWYKETACATAWNFSTDTVTGNTTLYAKWTSSGGTPTGGGGGGYYPTTYPIDIPSGIPNGTVSASPKSASRGTTITITVIPDEGYEISEVTVKDKDGKEIPITGKGDGKFTFTMPAGKVTVSASFTRIKGSYANCPKDYTCPVWPYTDASVTAWYHDGVHYCIENGLMSGYGNHTFGPDGNTNRAMIATILWRLEGSPVVNYILPFDDVAEGVWYTEAIRWASASGVVSGYGNGKFGPGDPITREQLAAMLYRYEQYKGGGFTGAWMFPLNFTDAELVSSWAYEPMCWTTMNGIINGIGNGQLDPKGKATRAQVATMIMRFCEKK